MQSPSDSARLASSSIHFDGMVAGAAPSLEAKPLEALVAKLSKMVRLPRRKTAVPASNVNRQPVHSPDESKLLALAVARAHAGDRTGLRDIYELCHLAVYRVSVRMVGAQDAADVAQQVFLQAFRTLGQFRAEASFRTWLHRLTINECLQHLRRQSRHKHVALNWDPPGRPCQEKAVDQKELLENALAQIEPELRSIFVLRELESLSYAELAEALNIPEGTVGSRLNRARRELQVRLRELRGEL